MVNIGSRDWQDMLDKLERIAAALESLGPTAELTAKLKRSTDKLAGAVAANTPPGPGQ